MSSPFVGFAHKSLILLSQVGVVVLVVIDIVLVLAELLLDLQIVAVEGEHHFIVPVVLHYCSIGILGFFIIEITVRLFVMRLTFFSHKLEVGMLYECFLFITKESFKSC